MKYIANPVEVEAFKILEIAGAENNVADQTPTYHLVIGDPLAPSHVVVATPEMTSRMTPKIGDYWVIQSDGYVYLNPKEVFERKYRAVNPIEA